MEIQQLTCTDGKQLNYRIWLPENNNVHSIVHILHGMAEHGARYDRFAMYLNTLGIGVYAQDHRGHGLTASDDDLGWFAEKQGWKRVLEDSHELDMHILGMHPGKDLFIFGHSMGSFMARALVAMYPELYTGAIICGTGASQGLVGTVGKLLARARSIAHHGKRPDQLLDKLSFGAFGKAFQPQKTAFDWLSRDEEEVRAYLEDPFCGFVCTSRFFVDLLTGIELANDPGLADKIPKDFPLYIISGANDPVGNFGKGVRQVHEMYRRAGITDLSLDIVKGARHELLNETNREDIHRMLGTWLEMHKSRRNR